MKHLYKIALVLCLCLPAISAAAADNPEIDFLIDSIRNSQCSFTRNGTVYSPEKAADHLQMKYNKTKKYIKSAEDFIEKLATKSSWSGKPYTMTCNGVKQQSGTWLSATLASYKEPNL